MKWTLIAVLALSVSGCKDACDAAADHIASCDIDVGDAPEGTDYEAQECTDEVAEVAECISKQSCSSIESGEAFLECGN